MIGRTKQSGTALLISLVILVVMTVLGLSAMSNTVLEAKMATNIQQRQIAFQAAEKALRDAEAWLAANVKTEPDIDTKFSASGALYNAQLSGPLKDLQNTANWNSDAGSVQALGLTNVGSNNPRYIIEYVGKVQRAPPDISNSSGRALDPRFHAFKITAMGYGADKAATYLLTSTVFICLDGLCG